MKTLVTAIVLVALLSIAFHELSERDDRSKEALALPEISNPLPAKIPGAQQAVIGKIGRASKMTAQRVSTETREQKLFIPETLQVYLPEENRAVTITNGGLDNGAVRSGDSGEDMTEVFRLANAGGGHEAVDSDSKRERADRDSDDLDRNRDRDRDDHHFRDHGDDREHGDDHEHADRSERHHRE